MKAIALLVALNIFYSLNAQHIYVVDDNDFYALIKINSKSTATVRSVFLGGRLKGMAGGHYRFYLCNDTLQYKTFSHEENYDDTKGQGTYNHYPWYLSVRNNNFIISTFSNDSLVYDDAGRIKEVYGLKFGDKITKLHSRLKYLNDTTILRIAITYLNINSGIYLYQLDKEGNLRAVKEASILTKQAISDSVSIDNIAFWKTTRFIYDKSRTRIDSIQILEDDGKAMRLFSTQYFIYKNNLPISSHIRDGKTNKIIYRQTYKYTSIK